MFESKPLVAFDQHAASVTAAALFPGARRPAVHQMVPDLPTIRRFVKKLRRHGLEIERCSPGCIIHDAWSSAGSVTSRTSSPCCISPAPGSCSGIYEMASR